jgi:ABC-type multidrug transport system fused ATPase/permease subunit
MLLIQAGWAVLLSITTFAPTLLLRAILEYVENPFETPINVAWLYVVLMFVTGLLSALTQGQATWIGQKISLRLRSIAIAEVYEKALRRKAVAQSSTILGAKAMKPSDSSEAVDTQANVGTIINLMSVDAFHLGEVGASLHLLWISVPTQIVIALALLYQVLSLSAIPGIAMMLLMFPINSVLAKNFGKIQMEVMGATDLRIETTNEMLRNIRIIKYFTWEQQCQKVVGKKRAGELKVLRKRFILWSIAATIWYGAPLLITFLSFVSYTAMEKKALKPSTAFTALSLFNLLKVPLDQFADILAKVQSSLASVNRIEEFLNEEETSKYSQLEHNDLYSDNDGTPKIGFENATFSWESDYNRSPVEARSSFLLRDVDVKFVIGHLNLIVGPTGSGKSSMLMALLGEMTLQHGKVYLPQAHRHEMQRGLDNGLTDTVAYCAQTPWLVNDTIRQNILFTAN